ncbi:hypothetical protein AB835_09205 [Candidatus Endobugula sertula]|uniref:Fe2OG dioxygenase domain-containing protein n=1 Tax=Candidatus Endobugula sertula TaxID=62101 RepID=A0A1D2QP79_9GAMM|nr:hypothetical protein AB835_09205 [Candidatus Endobugula sertula]
MTDNVDTVLSLIKNFILTSKYRQLWYIKNLKRQFMENGYVYLPNLFSSECFSTLKQEALKLENHAINRNYFAEETSTPRNMQVIGGRKLVEVSPLFLIIYLHHELRNFIQLATDSAALNSENEREVFGVHYMTNTKNTHGWHLDDGPFILVLFLQSPEIGEGGLMECITDWDIIKQQQNFKEDQNLESHIDLCRKKGLVKKFYHAEGDAYLLAGNKILHRVSPITKPNRKRIIFVSSYLETPNAEFTSRVTGLYDEPKG